MGWRISRFELGSMWTRGVCSELLDGTGVQLPLGIADELEHWWHNMESWAQGFDY